MIALLILLTCLAVSSFSLYCMLDSILLTFTFQVIVTMVEAAICFIPPIFIPGDDYTDWAVRIVSLLLGNFWLCSHFANEGPMPFIFIVNAIVFFIVNSFMLGSKNS